MTMKKILFFTLTFLLSPFYFAQAFYLSWNQDTSVSVTGFEVERKVKNGTYAVIAKLAADARTYQDTTTGLTLDQTYCYHVLTLGSGGSKSPASSEVCQLYAGVRLYLDSGQTVLISRRATNTSTIVAILVNANQKVIFNQPGDPAAGAVTVNLRPGITLTTSKRATSGASTISLLVNSNEVVTVNGVKK